MSDQFLSNEINKRLRFFGIDKPRVQDRIRRMGDIAAPELTSFVTEAFDTALALEEDAEAAIAARDELIDLLTAHLRLMLQAKFDEELECSYHLLLNGFGDRGKDTRLFLSIGAVVMRSILRIATKRLLWRPVTFAKCGMAMGSLFSFDVSVALHLQLHMERQALANRALLIDAEISEFRASVADIVSSVGTMTEQVAAASDAVDQATADTAARSDAIASSILGTTTAIQHSSKTISALDESASEISNQTAREAEIARAAVDQSRQSGAAIENLSSALMDIDGITEMIAAIAAQTNLLALNATIESARAGEAGRGFAVVATEVKALARKTEEATADIRTKLAKIQTAAEGTTTQIGSVTKLIGDLSETATYVSAGVGEQRVSVADIRRNIEKVASNMTSMQDGLTQLIDSSIGSARHAGSLVNAVKDLQSRSDRFTNAFDALASRLKSA